MGATVPLPRFRPLVKVVPIRHEGKDVFVAADPQEALFDQQLLLPPFAFVVANFLDGRRDAKDIREEIARQLNGAQVKDEEIEAVVRELDEHLLLETERTAERRRQVDEEYLKAPARPARFLQGTAEAVRKELDGCFVAPAGAGRPDGKGAGPPAAVMAPHIDLPPGGNCYSFPYREVAGRSDAEVYVVLGVAHLSPPRPFTLTSKSYETPLGTAETDRGIFDELARRAGKGCLEFETAHRSEHSVEFQAVFLKHARPDAKFTILPVLCSAFEPLCGSASPGTSAEIAEFLDALAEVLRGRKVCFVAGVDLSHVGPVFGDDVEVDPKLVRWMVKGDERSLRACADGNAEAFWNSVMEDGNRRHVCGLSAVYSMLRLLGGARGKILKYGFAPDPGGGLVSFAGMSFAPAPTSGPGA